MNAYRLPNLVIAGVGAAGTTSLFYYLIQHPDICGSNVKEVRYFTPVKQSTGFYADHIDPWLEAFGSAFRVVSFEDLVHDARALI
jgi:hypothetical protein